MNMKLKPLKSLIKKLLLTQKVFLHSKSVERKIIDKVYSYIKSKDVFCANEYFMGSYNSLLSINKYCKNGFSDGLQTFRKDKKSDTVFILGSGPSINELTESNWEFIAKNESIGFNFWFYHDFVPTKFFLQSTPNPLYDEIMTKAYLSKQTDYQSKGCKFYCRGDDVNNYKFQNSFIYSELIKNNEKLNFIGEHFIHGGIDIPPLTLMNEMYKLGCFGFEGNRLAPKFRSTIGMMISMALMAGYKNIVLSGIDMNDNGHFFDSEDYLIKYPELRDLIARNNKNGKVNAHVALGKYTVKEYIIALNSLAKSKFDAQISVTSKISTLYPDIDCFQF